jgi:hypothetical protein
VLLGFELRGTLPLEPCLQPSKFWLFFEIGSHFLPRPAGMTSMCNHTQLFSIEKGSHKLFCPCWPRTSILLISVSCSLGWQACAIVPSLADFLPTLSSNHDLLISAFQVARIIGGRHRGQAGTHLVLFNTSPLISCHVNSLSVFNFLLVFSLFRKFYSHPPTSLFIFFQSDLSHKYLDDIYFYVLLFKWFENMNPFTSAKSYGK